ncbi:MAG TPA: hypothetical protein VKU00_04025 [Chthonomonadaceae bacterium]|nr:hypothetical protein [Chthonomonadaceae bacterium]
MLEHTTANREAQSTSVLGTLEASPAVSDALTSDTRAQIEDYLDQVCAPLVKYVPYAERKERRREMEMHLEALTQAFLELGSDPLEAVTLALKQFGPPQKVARRWLHEWERAALRVATRSARPAMKWALPRFLGLSLFLAVTLQALEAWGLHLSPILPSAYGYVNPLINVQFTLILGLPLLLGLYTGLRARSRPVLGTLYAQLWTVPLFPLVADLIAPWFGFGSHLLGSQPSALLMEMVIIFSWIAPCGCLGALCGQWMRRWSEWRVAISP